MSNPMSYPFVVITRDFAGGDKVHPAAYLDAARAIDHQFRLGGAPHEIYVRLRDVVDLLVALPAADPVYQESQHARDVRSGKVDPVYFVKI